MGYYFKNLIANINQKAIKGYRVVISLIYRLTSDFLQGKNLNFGGNAAGFKVKGGFFNRKQ